MAYILDEATTISCPHGIKATVSRKATKVKLGGNAPLLVDETFTFPGCSFAPGGVASPCLTVQWSAPATKVTVQSSPVLLSSSVGLCLNPANVPQGKAQVSGNQTKVSAQ